MDIDGLNSLVEEWFQMQPDVKPGMAVTISIEVRKEAAKTSVAMGKLPLSTTLNEVFALSNFTSNEKYVSARCRNALKDYFGVSDLSDISLGDFFKQFPEPQRLHRLTGVSRLSVYAIMRIIDSTGYVFR